MYEKFKPSDYYSDKENANDKKKEYECIRDVFDSSEKTKEESIFIQKLDYIIAVLSDILKKQ
jgi:hypothetical protein